MDTGIFVDVVARNWQSSHRIFFFFPHGEDAARWGSVKVKDLKSGQALKCLWLKMGRKSDWLRHVEGPFGTEGPHF